MATCTVGCKFPSGLELELNGVTVVLNGSNSTEIIGGFGITENVDKDFMDAWIKQHKDSSLVSTGCVFIQEVAKNAKAQAKDNADLKSGFEPINPDKLPPGIEAATAGTVG